MREKTNIRKLAEIIYDTGHSKEILAVLDILFSAALVQPEKQEGGEQA